MRPKPYDWRLRGFATLLVKTMRLSVKRTSFYMGIAPSTVRRWIKEDPRPLRGAVDRYQDFVTWERCKQSAKEVRKPGKVIPLFPSPRLLSGVCGAVEESDAQTKQAMEEVDHGLSHPIDDLVEMIIEDIELGERIKDETE